MSNPKTQTFFLGWSLSSSPIGPSHVARCYVFRADHLVLDSQLRGSSLEKTGSGEFLDMISRHRQQKQKLTREVISNSKVSVKEKTPCTDYSNDSQNLNLCRLLART